MQQSLVSILTILIGMYGLRLAYAAQLTYYIHPRYTLVTTIACGALVIVGICAFALAPEVKLTRRRSMRGIVGLTPVIIFVIIGVAFPAKPLSSAAAAQRTTSNVVVPQAAPADSVSNGVVDVSTVNTSEWTFDDFWYSLMIQDKNLSHYEGKPAHLLGFVTHPPSSPEGTFYLTRFLLMCCAIDAQPVGFWVREDAAKGTAGVANDKWLDLQGVFHVVDWKGSPTLVLDPESVQPTEQPEDPYVY